MITTRIAHDLISEYINKVVKKVNNMKGAYAAYLNNIQSITECDKIVESLYTELYDLMHEESMANWDTDEYQPISPYGEAKYLKEQFEHEWAKLKLKGREGTLNELSAIIFDYYVNLHDYEIKLLEKEDE